MSAFGKIERHIRTASIGRNNYFQFQCPRVRSGSAYLSMKSPSDIANWPQGLDWDNSPPAQQALDARLVTEQDLLRLKVIARLHARGLPPDIGWADLLQEAFARVLDGSRRQPDGVPMSAFISGVMRSIKEQYWRQARRKTRQLPKLIAEYGPTNLQDGETIDTQPNPERRIIAIQQIEQLLQLFEDDPQSRLIMSGLYEGRTPDEICAINVMSKTDYDSTRKRIRRAIIKSGLRMN